MKKKTIVLALASAMLMAALTGCSGSSAETEAPAETAAATEAAQAEAEAGEEAAEAEEAEAAGEGIQGKFLYIITDNLGDMGFRDNGLYGVQNVCETYGCEYDVIELGSDKSTYENAFADACDSGEYTYLVTCSNGGMSDLVMKYAPDYPEMRFVTFDVGATTEVTADNVCAINYRQNEGAYLAGVLAASISDTQKIGAWVFNEVPIGHDFVTGYVDGARAVNPDIDITVSYGSGAVNIGKTQEVTGTMFDSGIDTVFNVQGSTTSGAATACYDRGGLDAGLAVIGVDSDQYTVYTTTDSTLKDAATTIVTSMLKDVTYSLEYLFAGIEDGSIQWGNLVSFGLAEKSVCLADNEHFEEVVPAEVHTVLDEYTEKIANGEIEPKGFFTTFDSDVAAFEEWRDNG